MALEREVAAQGSWAACRRLKKNFFSLQEKSEPTSHTSPSLQQRQRSVTLDTVPQSNSTPPKSPLKDASSKGDQVFTSTPHRQSKVPPLQGVETSPRTGCPGSPPATPTRSPSNQHQRLTRHHSYGYRQVGLPIMIIIRVQRRSFLQLAIPGSWS